MPVAILGASISGLVAAQRLIQRGVDVEILEMNDRPGGLCQSDVVDGYVMDHAGGHIIFSKDSRAMQFYHALFEDEPLVRNERHTRILFKGRAIPYPFENGIGELDPADRRECLQGFLAAALRRADGALKPDNFRDWIRHHVGDGIFEMFMQPYNRKIWEIQDLRQMGVSWVDGRIPEAPLGDIIKSALGTRTVGYAHQAIFFYPQRGGFQSLTDRVARKVKGSLRLSTRVTDIARSGDRFRVNGRLYDSVVSTIPLPILSNLVSTIDSTTREAAAGLGYISLACFMFGVAAEDVKPLSWVYLPHPEQGPANRITYLSNYSPNNAPAGRGSVLAEVTYRGACPVDHEMVRVVRHSLTRQGLFRDDHVTVEEWRDNKFAYLHFGHDFVQRRQAAIDGFESHGIFPLGRFGRYNYYNTDLCILEALAMADKVAERLGAARP